MKCGLRPRDHGVGPEPISLRPPLTVVYLIGRRFIGLEGRFLIDSKVPWIIPFVVRCLELIVKCVPRMRVGVRRIPGLVGIFLIRRKRLDHWIPLLNY